MKIKELMAQLSTYDQEANVELMYSFHDVSVNGIIRLTEKNFMIVPHVGNVDKMHVDSVLLATSHSLVGE